MLLIGSRIYDRVSRHACACCQMLPTLTNARILPLMIIILTVGHPQMTALLLFPNKPPISLLKMIDYISRVQRHLTNFRCQSNCQFITSLINVTYQFIIPGHCEKGKINNVTITSERNYGDVESASFYVKCCSLDNNEA